MFYLVMLSVMVGFVTIGVINWGGRDRPVYWGAFTAASTTCAPRAGCFSVGRWVSTDGTIVKEGVRLDGAPDAHGQARAGYQPGGPMGETGTTSSTPLRG